MASFTSRFGFSFFGGRTSGSLTDDGSKYTVDDPQVLDRVLAALETHTHEGGDRLADPADPPVAQLITTAGALPADATYYYCVSFLDRFGLETRSSEEISVQTPQSVAPPAGPALESVEGGVLTPGLYYYALTIITGQHETQLSAPSMIGVTEGDGSVLLTLPILSIDGASFRVWRQGPGEAGFTKVALSSDITFIDDGSIAADPCACDPANLPPVTNETNSTNSVTITLSEADRVVLDQDRQSIRAWRLYRTDVSGNYSADSLVHEVVERQDVNDATSPLLASWIDDGDPLLAGRPRIYSQTLRPSSPYLLPRAAELPAPADYPDGYPLLHGGLLYVRLDGIWKPVGGGAGPAAQGTPWPDYVFTGADGRRWRQVVDANGQLQTVETALPGAPVPPANLQVS